MTCKIFIKRVLWKKRKTVLFRVDANMHALDFKMRS